MFIASVVSASGFTVQSILRAIQLKGEGAKATPPDMRSNGICWTMTREDAERVWNMAPDDVLSEMALLWGMNVDEMMIPVEHGNITVR